MTAAMPADIAYQVLRLEEKLDSYQRLHAEELEQLRQALHELKSQLLALAGQKDTTVEDQVSVEEARQAQMQVKKKSNE